MAQVEMLRSPLVDGHMPGSQGSIASSSQQPPVLANICQVSPPQQTVQMTSVEVRIPNQALPGQSIQFSLPSGQPVSVPVQERLEAGSVITVQVPVPQASPAVVNATAVPVTAMIPGQGAQLPQPTVIAQQDQQAAKIGWIIYGAGWLTCCFMGPVFAFVMWAIAAGMFYCKPSQERNNLPRQKTPAKVAAMTMGGVCAVSILMAIVVAAYVLIMGTDGFPPIAPHDGSRHHPHPIFMSRSWLPPDHPAPEGGVVSMGPEGAETGYVTSSMHEANSAEDESNADTSESDMDSEERKDENDVEDDKDMGSRDREESFIPDDPPPKVEESEAEPKYETMAGKSPLIHLAHAFNKIGDPKQMAILTKHMDKLPTRIINLLNHTQKLLNHTQQHFQQVGKQVVI